VRALDGRILRHVAAARRDIALTALAGVLTAGLIIAQAGLLADLVTRAFLGGEDLGALTGVLTALGGVVVAPRASELIHPVSLAVAQSLTADQLAQAFTVYPSMSGSVAEAARRLHRA